MTRYLLDTHVVIWAGISSDRLSRSMRSVLADPEQVVLVSSVSIGEMVIKQQLGKLTLPSSPHAMVRALEMDELDFTGHHAQAVSELPMHHRDPFDRWLIAQARVEGLTLVSADAAIRLYDIDVVDPSG